jgi:RNA polymerase sigma factor (sigma-70 family)
VTGAERAAEEMEIEELRQAISELSQKDRELLKMRLWDSMTHQEIAEVIGTSVQNINKCR